MNAGTRLLALAPQFEGGIDALTAAPRISLHGEEAARMPLGGRVGHVDLVGYLDRPYTIGVGRRVLELVRSPSIGEIQLYCDSPGGDVGGVPELAAVIRQAAAQKPVRVLVEGYCCSGALWICSQATQIVATESSTLGGCGAYILLVDDSELFARLGLKVYVIKSGDLKAAGQEGLAPSADQLAMWQRRVDLIAVKFEAALQKGRRLTNDETSRLMTGEDWLAEQARRLGLADAVQSAEEFFADGERRHPRELYANLFGSAAASQFDELVSSRVANRMSDRQWADAERVVAEEFPTLAQRARDHEAKSPPSLQRLGRTS